MRDDEFLEQLSDQLSDLDVRLETIEWTLRAYAVEKNDNVLDGIVEFLSDARGRVKLSSDDVNKAFSEAHPCPVIR